MPPKWKPEHPSLRGKPRKLPKQPITRSKRGKDGGGWSQPNKDKGKQGTWTLYDRWFEEHVYTIIVNKRHVPANVLKVFKQKPKTLPAWYPGAMGLPGK